VNERIALIDAGFSGMPRIWLRAGKCSALPFPKTLRGTPFSVPPKCCLLGCPVRYFFFAAFFAPFFAAFFAGFLAAFLVAICLFSLFDGLHRVLQIKLQLKNV
jgi:hypothetical protein